MTSSHHGPYVRGYTRNTMDEYNGRSREVEEIQKTCLSSDWSLQLDSMKLESLVIVDQRATVNTFPGLVHTARQAMEAGGARSHVEMCLRRTR
jgi:hypothetical protein